MTSQTTTRDVTTALLLALALTPGAFAQQKKRLRSPSLPLL